MRFALVLLVLLLGGLWMPSPPLDARAGGRIVPGGPIVLPDVAKPVPPGQLLSKPGPVAEALTGPSLTSSTTEPTPLELALVELVNADRAEQGLDPVTFDASLLSLARARATAQAQLAHLSHTDDSGRLAFAGLLAEARLDFRLAGENLARLVGPGSTAADRAERALMASPSHRANILEARFNHVAVGSATDANGRIIFVQIFRAVG